jgi:hypothetical protein
MSSSATYKGTIRRKLSVRGHHQQLFAHKAPTGAVLQIVQHRIPRLSDRPPKSVYVQRPDRICCTATSTFQLSWLIKKADTNCRRELLLT